MKAEVIREIARKNLAKYGLAKEGLLVSHTTEELTIALKTFEQAGFVVLPKEELEAALKGMLRHAPLVPDHFTDTTFVDVPVTAKSVRRAAALLAAITQEKSDGL